MKPRAVHSWLVGTFLLLALTWALVGSRSHDQDQHARREASMRNLKHLDTRQDQDLLEARLQMAGNYDLLVEDEQRISSALADPALAIAEPRDGPMAVLHRRLGEAFGEKAHDIESFKSVHAILRNSTDYFPVAANDLNQVIERAPRLQPLERSLRQLVLRVLAYDRHDRDGQGANLDAAIAELAALRDPQRPVPALDAVLVHARTLASERQATDQLVTRILAAPTGVLLDSLAEAHADAERQVRAMAERHRLALYPLALALFAWGVLAWWRLRRANANLEQRIVERTADLNRSEGLLRTILASAADGIVGFDAGERATFANPAAERLLGRSGDRLLGSSLADLCGAEAAARLRTFGASVVECRIGRTDGTAIACELTCAANRQNDDLTGLFVVSMRDVTLRQQLQDQLAGAKKLEAIGQLAAGVAHEINTPTQYIGDNVRFLRDSFQDIGRLIDAAGRLAAEGASGPAADALCALQGSADFTWLRSECPRAIAESLDGVERVASIVSSMKDFVHPDRTEKEAVDLNRVISSATTVCRNEWRYVADLALELEPDLPAIDGYTGDLGQMILNLVVNSAHAIADIVGDGSGGKGRIVVRSRVDGDAVIVQVEDSGAGIPDAVKPRIFEQFFTTKGVGKGTGQGLAQVHRLVTRHAGKVWFESAVGKGTTFIVRLPIREPAAQQAVR